MNEDDLYMQRVQEILAQRNQSAPVEPQPQAEPEPSSDYSVLGEAGRAVVGGVRDAVQETLDTVDYLGDSLGETFGDLRYTDEGIRWVSSEEITRFNEADPTQLGQSVLQLPEVGENQSTVGGVGRGITQFLTGFVGGARALKGLGMTAGTGVGAKAAHGALTGGVADFTVFDAHEERFSNFLQEQTGLSDPITDYLAADPNDSIAEGKLKNVLEGLALGAAGDAMLTFVRSFKAAKQIDVSEGADAAAAFMNEQMGEIEKAVAKDSSQQLELFDDAKDSAETTDFSRASPSKEAANEVGQYNSLGLSAPSEKPKAQINVDGFREAWTNEAFLRSAGGPGVPNNVNFTDFTQGRLFNHDYMDGASEIKTVLNLAADAIDPSALPNATTFDAIYKGARKELADATQTSPEALDATIRRMAVDADRQKRVVVAGKMMIQDLAREIDALATKLEFDSAAGKDTLGDNAKLIRYVERLGDLEANLKQIVTGSAQTTAAGRIRTRDMLTGNDLNVQDIATQLRDVVDRQGGEAAMRDIVKKIRATSQGGRNISGLVSIARQGRGRRLVDIHNEYWINSLLSGPKTHAINLISNAAHTLLLPSEKIIGGAIGGDVARMREGYRMYSGIRASIYESFRAAGDAFYHEQNILDPQGVIREGTMDQQKAISSANLGLKEGSAGAAFVDVIGSIVRVPSRALIGGDELFKQINYRAAVHSKMAGEAFDLVQSGRLDKRDVNKWIADRLSKSFDGDGRGTSVDGIAHAREATFTRELDRGTVAKNIQTTVNQTPILRILLPFIRTPTNITRAFVQRTPLLHKMNRQMMDDLRSNDPSRVAAARGKLASGTMLWGGATMLAMDGRITGGGPNDPALKSRLLETGWQPYSIRLGDEETGYRYVSYSRMDPFATFFGIAADVSDIAGQKDDAEVGDIMAMGITALANNVVSKSYLQGMIDAVKVLTMPDWHVERWLQRQTATYVPFSSAQRQMRQLDDPAMREVWSTVDAIKNTIPGLSKDLPARHSWITGEPILYPKGLGADSVSPVGEALAASSPFQVRDSVNDPVLSELARLEHGFSPPLKKIGDVELTSSQYSELLKLHGTIRLGRYTMRQRLESEINSQRYQTIANQRIAPDEYRLRIVRSIIEDYRSAAQSALIRNDSSLRQQVRQAQEQDGLRLRGALSPLNKLISQ